VPSLPPHEISASIMAAKSHFSDTKVLFSVPIIVAPRLDRPVNRLYH
jgi:hypothetical protein